MARADEGLLAGASASGGGQGLFYVVFITLCLALGYVVVHVIDRRIPQLRILVAGGLEYIVFGIVLSQFELVTPETVTYLSPVISFGIGSVGLLVGIGTHKDRQPTLDEDSTRGGVFTSLFPAVLVVGAFYLWIQIGVLMGDTGLGTGYEGATVTWVEDIIVGCLVLGGAAAISATELIETVIRENRPRVGFVSRTLINTAYLSEMIGIVVFGFAFCAVHLGDTGFRTPTVLEWFAINILLGLLLGFLFALFLGRDEDSGEEEKQERFFVAGLGIVVFSSGLSYYLTLSPLLVCFVTGAVLARVPAARNLGTRLESIEKPGYIVLFIFLGFAWSPPGWYGWLLVAAVLAARLAGKGLGAYFNYYYSHKQAHYGQGRHGIGLALAAQGGLVAALALNYRQVYETPLSSVILNALVVGILINEAIGRRAIRRVLVNAGEIKLGDEVKPMAPNDQIDWYAHEPEALVENDDGEVWDQAPEHAARSEHEATVGDDDGDGPTERPSVDEESDAVMGRREEREQTDMGAAGDDETGDGQDAEPSADDEEDERTGPSVDEIDVLPSESWFEEPLEPEGGPVSSEAPNGGPVEMPGSAEDAPRLSLDDLQLGSRAGAEGDEPDLGAAPDARGREDAPDGGERSEPGAAGDTDESTTSAHLTDEDDAAAVADPASPASVADDDEERA